MMNETPGDYLTDYGTVVYVKSVEVVGDYIYHNGRYNFEANSTVKITYHLENPNQFELYDGTSVAPGETPLVTSAFPAGSDLETNPPALNYDAEFQTITLTYGASGADHDPVKGNVSPTIWIYRADGRPQSAYTLPIFCDTPEKLDPPTFTWTQPQATGKDYGTLEISCAAAPYATINYTVTNASGDVVASGSHNGTTVLNLYPEKIGGVGIQYSAEATASFGGCYPSDAATGNETIEGTKLTTPTSNSNDATAGWVSQVNNIEERDYAEYILTATEAGAKIHYEIERTDVTPATTSTGEVASPAKTNLGKGTYTVTATAQKDYCKNSTAFTENLTVKSNVVYVSASGSDTTGNGSKTKPYATLSKAASNKTEDISVIFLTDMLITNDTDMNITGSTGKTTLRPSGSSRITIYCDDESGASFDVRGTIEVNNINFARSAGSTSTKPAINVGSGSLTLNNVTISGITSDTGAVVVTSFDAFAVKDNVVITNNKNTSGKPCNVNLGDSSGGLIKVDSALSGTKIGVTVAESRAPTPGFGGADTPFTSYYSNCGSTTPQNYFTSDQGYAVIYDANQPWLSYTGGSGTIIVNAPPSITFALEETTTAGITTVTIKATQTVGGTTQDVTAKMGSWNCNVYFGGTDTRIPTTGNSITFPAEVDSATFNITFSCVYNEPGSPYNGFACGGGLLYEYTKP